ncbi:MAG: leucine-rich repeat domain-containing protein [Oscillospiraceae bacterium]|nr:leucine-rich repeat domain-containing protein [Oscillospiraceae bacterium]
MNSTTKKRLFIFGGAGLAVLVVIVVLIIALGGGSGKKYEEHFSAAQTAFLQLDYDTAQREVEAAMEIDSTEECYLLLANIYHAQGKTDEAIQTLYLGYSRVGGSAIETMLDSLKDETGTAVPVETEDENDSVTIAGGSYAADTTTLLLSGQNLTDSELMAVSALTELESLSLSSNSISDLSPLSGLTKLTSLQLSNNRISDLTPLSSLSGLKTLYLDGNPIADFTPLYHLTALRTLSMKDVDITEEDLTALEEALPDCNIFTDSDDGIAEITLGDVTFTSDVTELNLSGQGLTDISALSACRDLVKLDLRDNQITDISALVEMQNLEWLCLWNNKVEDITPLMTLTKLTYLDLDTNQISDITVLNYLTELEGLWLNNNSIRRFTALQNLTKLERLGVKSTGLSDDDLTLFYDLSSLKELSLDDNDGLSADAVEALQKALPKCTISHSELLYTVTLGGTTYTSDATEILASGQGITDLSGLEQFTSLVLLDLDDNSISDLSPLYGLTNLKTLYIRGNNVTAADVEKLQVQLPNCRIHADAEDAEDETTSAAGSQNTTVHIATGVSAAISAAGTGSGYAILWDAGDTVSVAIRTGFATEAKELGMNLVYDDSFPSGETDFTGYLTDILRYGADRIFLAVDDDTLSQILEQAETLDYGSAQFIQIY